MQTGSKMPALCRKLTRWSEPARCSTASPLHVCKMRTGQKASRYVGDQETLCVYSSGGSSRQVPMNVVVLTGDGLAAESGLRPFGDVMTGWERFSPYHQDGRREFARASREHRQYYDVRRTEADLAQPNAAHQALARLEKRLLAGGHQYLLSTHCLDDLHTRAGSQSPLCLVGAYREKRCWACKATLICEASLEADPGCSACGHQNSAMAGVRWWSDPSFGMAQIEAALATANLFVAIGTSAAFQPPSALVARAWHRGVRTLEFNTDGSATSGLFHERRFGAAIDTVPIWVAQIIADLEA